MLIKPQLDILTIINEESNSGNQSHCEKSLSKELEQIPKLDDEAQTQMNGQKEIKQEII